MPSSMALADPPEDDSCSSTSEVPPMPGKLPSWLILPICLLAMVAGPAVADEGETPMPWSARPEWLDGPARAGRAEARGLDPRPDPADGAAQPPLAVVARRGDRPSRLRGQRRPRVAPLG